MSLDRKSEMPRGKGFKPRTAPMPQRTVRLNQVSPAKKRGTGLARAPRARDPKPRAQTPRGGIAAAVALVMAGEVTCSQAVRICGLEASAVRAVKDAAGREFRRLVMERDGQMCQARAAEDCSAWATDVQHRVKRGSGGTSDPRIAFGLSNGIALCRACHDLCDRAYSPVMYERGFWRWSNEDPAQVPVAVASEGGLALVWLLPDGTRSTSGPAVAA